MANCVIYFPRRLIVEPENVKNLSIYLVKISFPPAYYWDIDDNEGMMDYLIFDTVLDKYEHFCCSTRDNGLSFLDYWISFRNVDYQDLLKVVKEIEDLGIICKVEYCNDKRMEYRTFFEN